MARVVTVLALVVVALAIVYLTSHPIIFDNRESGKALGVGDLANVEPNYRYSSDPSHRRRISALQKHETATIQYRSVGNGEVSYKLDITRRDDGVIQMRDSDDRSGNVVSRVLDDAEIAGLDRLLEYYRSRRDGFCSRQDLIQIRWTSAGGDLADEVFVDSTCLVQAPSGVVALPDLFTQGAS